MKKASASLSPAPSPASRLHAATGVRHSARLWLGLTITMAGVWALCSQFWLYAQHHPVVWQALLGGSMAALATALGTLPVMLSQRMSERTQDTLFGFGAGVMLAACAFSLILPGLEAAKAQALWGGGGWGAGGVMGTSILLGAAALMAMDKLLPHEHFIKGREGLDGDAARKLQRTWLFVIAIALHNLPEGLVVAVALLAAGYRRRFAVLLGMASGLVEPVGAVIGAAVVSSSAVLLPWGLGFAAGAMLFVISHEIIPESHRKGHEAFATGGLMLGFVLMMVLDTALG